MSGKKVTALIILLVLLALFIFAYLFFLLYKNKRLVSSNDCSTPVALPPGNDELPCCAVDQVLNGRRYDLTNGFLLQSARLYPPETICQKASDIGLTKEQCLAQIQDPCNPSRVKALYQVGEEMYYPVSIGRSGLCDELVTENLIPGSCLTTNNGVFIGRT